jgi:hypothetical protein
MRAAFTAISMLVLAACNHASGQEAKASGQGGERSYQVGTFQRVSLAGPHDVIVTVGGAPSVRAIGDSDTLDKLEIRIDNGELIVGNRHRSSWSLGSRPHKATIYVTLPSLTAAAVAGSGDMKVDKVQGDRFEAAISGSGDLTIAAVKVGDASFNIAGSGGIHVSGSSDKASLSIAGSGGIQAAGFQTTDAKISIAGSGSARLKATGTATVNIMGSGSADIAGGAKCQVNKMGSGHANCTA